MGCLFHKWDGCVCTKCGKTRDEGHSYGKVEGRCAEKCARCGKEREAHDWSGCTCAKCGKTRDEAHTLGEDGFCVKCGAAGPEPYHIDYLSEAEKGTLISAVQAMEQIAAQLNNADAIGAARKIRGHLEAPGTVKLDVFDVEVILQAILPNIANKLRESGGEQNEKGAATLDDIGKKLAAHRAEIDKKIEASAAGK